MSTHKQLINSFYYLSLFLIVTGTMLVLFTPQILNYLPTFLEEKVFHRTFNHEAYKDSMISLIAFPIFFAIIIDTLLFTFISDTKKNVASFFYLASVLLTITIVSYTCAASFADQDLSSETLFGYECFREKTFWPKSWYYSMEFRFLNTQLITAPLFFFTKNLALIRALTVLFTEGVLFGATWFLLHELKIKAFWLKLLCCTLIISPVSWTFFGYVQAGSYYIPHIVFSFFYVGLAISLLYHNHSSKDEKKLLLIFAALSFFSGVSSIRYILNFTFPVFMVVAIEKFLALYKENERFEVKHFIFNKSVKIAGGGLFLSGIGYVFNSVILASIYTYKNMNKIQFNPLDVMRLDDIKDMLLTTAGFNENISVFTPGGVANVLLSLVFIISIIVALDYWKAEKSNYKKFFLCYVLFFFGFHLYTNIFTEMVGRYLTMVFVFFIPFMAVTIEGINISKVKKWILSASAAVVIMTNAYLSFSRMQTREQSLNLGGVAEYLAKNGYEFGYAFYNIANPIWFWTNGKVEIATVDCDEKDGVNVMASKYKIHKWLEPKRFEKKDYYKGDKHIFFAIKKKEYVHTSESKVLKAGNLVYQDDYYVVFDYESPSEFINAFDK